MSFKSLRRWYVIWENYIFVYIIFFNNYKDLKTRTHNIKGNFLKYYKNEKVNRYSKGISLKNIFKNYLFEKKKK